MIVYLATESEIKKQAVAQITKQFIEKGLIEANIEIIGKDTPSQVPSTPYNEETLDGARNRAQALYTEYKNKGDLFIGLESGLIVRYNHLFEESWCYILDKENKTYKSYSSGYALPQLIYDHLQSGRSHSEIMNTLGAQYKIEGKDTWGIYTNNIISRTVSIEEAFRNAFAAYILKNN